MSPQDLSLLLLVILAALYLPVLVTLLRQRAGQETASNLLIGYLVAALFLTLLEGFRFGARWQVDTQTATDIQLYGALLLSALMSLAVLSFTRRDLAAWLGVGAFWVLSIAAIVFNIFKLGDVVWTNGSVTLTRERLAPAWSALGWLIFTVGGFAIVRSAYTRSRQPLLRNRLNYWTPVFLLVVINDLLLIVGWGLPGNPIRLFAAALATLVVVTHDPPDLREVARRVLTYIITTLVIVAFYLAGTTASQRIFTALPNYNPLLVGAGIAILLSFIFTPLLSLVRRLVNRWFNLQEFHASRTLHAYSEQISNILDMQKLASMAVGLIIERMNITRGFLFLVDREKNPEVKAYQIRAVRSPGERQIKILTLMDDHPIVKHLVTDQRPLLQYDLDLLPAYKLVSQAEREWFKYLEAEVYLPIFSKREWIGLLALGAKISGNRYTPDDLVTLSAMASQTAVALENARLVDNLVQLNTELRQAYRSLDKANRDLERLDRTKSDFISIASHELRTPLTTMIGYTEMLLEDETFSQGSREMLKGISKGTKRLHDVVDSMFDLAQIDMRTMQMHVVPIDIALLIRDVGMQLEKTFNERKQCLTIEIPPLPKVKADPNLLEKLFQHLLSNAIKFTPNNGRVTVTAKALHHTIEMPEGALQVTVSDTGVGVEPDSREIIFSKFYQPGDLSKHSTSKTRFKGSGAGLGLALSKGIVEAHGGRIWVESAGYNEKDFPGSQFHVLLPMQKEETMAGTEVRVEIK
ncbi:MAG TPA: GAF domain-containing sensor histidine kinase [Anaerolineales bacterium]|nr:GAF domain-containing sensor histidine kinase [Anaerolineales bacterium]